MQLEVKNIQGKAVKTIDVPDDIFSVEVKDHLLHTVVKGYLANKRQGTHATKTKAMVSGGGKKPFKQKGTGNARQGSSRSPLNPGGGTAHGPQPRDYRQKLSKSVRQLALKMMLSDKARHGLLVVVDDFNISAYSTKHVLGALKTLGTSKALISDERKDDFMYRSTRNVHGSAYLAPNELNAEHLLRHESLVISENALSVLQQRLS